MRIVRLEGCPCSRPRDPLLLLRSSTFYFCARSIPPLLLLLIHLVHEGGGKERFEDVAFEDRSPTSPYPTINFSWRDNENVAVNGDKMSLASSARNPSVSVGSSENAIFKLSFVGSTNEERGNIYCGWLKRG